MQVYIFDIAFITAILACAKSTSVVSEAVADLRPVLTAATDDDALAEKRSGPAKMDSGEERVYGLPVSIMDGIPVPLVNAAFTKMEPVLQRLRTDSVGKQKKTTVAVAPQKAAVADPSNKQVSKQLADYEHNDWVNQAVTLVQKEGRFPGADPSLKLMGLEANKKSPEQIVQGLQLNLDTLVILAPYFEHLSPTLGAKESSLAYHEKARGNAGPGDVMTKLMKENEALEKKDTEALFQLLQKRYGKSELQSFLSQSAVGGQGGKLVKDLLARFWLIDETTISKPQTIPERERTMLRKEDGDQPAKHPKEIEGGYKQEIRSRCRLKLKRQTVYRRVASAREDKEGEGITTTAQL
uniref:RxLR effector candidate protein n=1 Tax=Hyaloperonospora arabidopsidis (strain Emoy2) TaxID=559515 RepID=M4BM40_HYAAE|nr:RxLR effector candidate protein [Hyaloperonospora arabidopsidis Emoy2]